MNFKVGDKVEVIREGISSTSQRHFGKVLTVSSVHESGPNMLGPYLGVEEATGGVYSDEVELVPRKDTRKDKPLFSGCLMYFPDALLAVSEHSKRGNDKHNPGQPLHWAKEKSKDQADCIARHLIDIGENWDGVDPETGSLHAQALAWRALALLQTVLDRKKNDDDKK